MCVTIFFIFYTMLLMPIGEVESGGSSRVSTAVVVLKV